MLKPRRTYNPTIGFSKYEFNNKLLGSVALFRVTSRETQTQLYISLFDVNFDKSTVRLHYFHLFFMPIKFQGDKK